MHGPAPRVRVRASSQRADRLNGRGAHRRSQSKQKGYAARQRHAEGRDAPVRPQREARRIVGRIDHPHEERRAPPGEHCADGGGQQSQPRTLYQNQLHQPPASRPDRTRSAISRARAAACAVIRLATLAHAIARTSITRMPNASSVRP